MYVQQGGSRGKRRNTQDVPGAPGSAPFTPINGGGPGKQDPRSPSIKPSIPQQGGNVYPGAPGGAPPMKGGGGGRMPQPAPGRGDSFGPPRQGGGGMMPQPGPGQGFPAPNPGMGAPGFNPGNSSGNQVGRDKPMGKNAAIKAERRERRAQKQNNSGMQY